MATVRSSQARTKFFEVLRRVEQGEQVLITRRGKPVARLIPIAKTQKVSAALARLRRLRQGTTLGRLDWKDLRDAGRKY